MDKFIGNVTDTTISKNPQGTWQRAKNILLTKGMQSISNEDGFLKKEDFSGVVIGSIISNEDEVYFILDDTTSEIGRIDKRVQNPSYEVVLRDDNLGFRLDCPIEGVYNYNYKGELIVTWSHGIRNNAARPMILNIDNPPFSITGGVLDNPNDLELIYLFPNIDEGNYNITRLEEGNLYGDVAYITYAYVYEDGSRTQFFPISNIAYITDGYLETNKYGLNIEITDLDTKFNSIKLGIVLKDEVALKGYISYEIPYTTADSVVYDLIGIDSWTETSADEIIIRSDSFSKIKTITSTYDQNHIGNTVKDSPLDLQQYANQLVLEPTLEISDETNQHSFMPDEVYAFFIEGQLLDGSYTRAFHIPGRVAAGTETDVLTAGQISSFNLGWMDASTKQFKVFNSGIVAGTNPYTATFGYWENEELYPNNVNYDSSGVGGSDLRNTPVRHHRFPSLRLLHALDDTYLPSRNGTSENYPKIIEGNQERFILGVKCTNFNTVFPQSIKDQLQGYRISYAKRNFSNSLIIDNCAMLKRIENFNDLDITAPSTYKCISLEPSGTPEYQKSRLFSAPLFDKKPSVEPTFVLGNYMHNGAYRALDADYTAQIGDAYYISEVDKVTYAPANNLSYGNQYTEEGIDIDLASSQNFGIPSAGLPVDGNVAINVSLVQLKDNLYPNLSSSELIIAGRVDDITATPILRFGDVSIKTHIDCSAYEIYTPASDFSQHWRLTYIGHYNPLHTMALYNETNVTYEIVEANYPLLEAREYEFSIVKNRGSSSLNDLNFSKTFNVVDEFVYKFLYRINSTNKIPTEGNIMEALRTFPVNSYYDMPNHKGEIWALRGGSKILYIQQKYSLFITQVKDRLYGQGENIYLGTSALFDTIPDEVVKDDKGYIGCTSQFACILFKGGYITVDQIQGKIFMIYGGKEEISAKGKRNYFEENWDIGFDISDNENGIEERVDNPFVSVGHIVGYDDKHNRLIFTKRHFKLKDGVVGVTREGQFYILDSSGDYINYNNTDYFEDYSRTWSFSLDNQVWVCEHNYIPNILIFNSSGTFSISNSFTGGRLFEHNILNKKGLYYDEVNPYASYIDLIFNGNLDISKLYESIMWVSDTINNTDGGDIYNKTITHIAVYNKTQATGLINLKDNEFLLTRTNEGHWNFNAFRDMVNDQFSPIIDNDGEFILSNLNNNKVWFENNEFISKFIVVRLYIDNISQNTTLIHSVNVKSIKSLR